MKQLISKEAVPPSAAPLPSASSAAVAAGRRYPRRRFLLRCLEWMGLIAGAGLAGLRAEPKEDNPRVTVPNVSLESLRFRDFARAVKTPFLVRNGPSMIRLELESATESAVSGKQSNAGDGKNEKFTLLFVGLKSERLKQNTYQFEHGTLGRFEMFIVPVRSPQSEGTNCVYQAVFNRPPPGPGGKPATGVSSK